MAAYKLSAVRKPDGHWEPKLKLSEQAAKINHPGILQVRRFRSASEFIGDVIYDSSRAAPESFTIVDPLDATRRKQIAPEPRSRTGTKAPDFDRS
jgi:nicotinate phosphoribosyltransferase